MRRVRCKFASSRVRRGSCRRSEYTRDSRRLTCSSRAPPETGRIQIVDPCDAHRIPQCPLCGDCMPRAWGPASVGGSRGVVLLEKECVRLVNVAAPLSPAVNVRGNNSRGTTTAAGLPSSWETARVCAGGGCARQRSEACGARVVSPELGRKKLDLSAGSPPGACYSRPLPQEAESSRRRWRR